MMTTGQRIVLLTLALNFCISIAANLENGAAQSPANRRAMEVGLNFMGLPLKFRLGRRKKIPRIDQLPPGALQAYERKKIYGGDFKILGIPFGLNVATIHDDYRYLPQQFYPMYPNPNPQPAAPAPATRRYLPVEPERLEESYEVPIIVRSVMIEPTYEN